MDLLIQGSNPLLWLVYQGSSVPLVVKWADTEKERLARRAQKAHSQAANEPNGDSQHPSLFGALPMGYVPSYNGYGYQVSFFPQLCLCKLLFSLFRFSW